MPERLDRSEVIDAFKSILYTMSNEDLARLWNDEGNGGELVYKEDDTFELEE